MNEWVISESGRRFKRNEENTGTIMEWNDNGTVKHTIVFDAKYRSMKEYSNTNNLPSPYYTNTGGTIDDIWIRRSPDNYTDDILNSKSICNQDNRSNREATTNLINTIGISIDYACGYVRSLTNLNSNGCDLPNINCLARIWCDAEILDSMDPTIEEYSQYGLTDWFSDYTEYTAWSSSCFDSFLALYIYSNSNVYVNSYNYQYGVIPVYDL